MRLVIVIKVQSVAKFLHSLFGLLVCKLLFDSWPPAFIFFTGLTKNTNVAMTGLEESSLVTEEQAEE